MILNYEKPSVKKWMALEADRAIAVFGMPWFWLTWPTNHLQFSIFQSYQADLNRDFINLLTLLFPRFLSRLNLDLRSCTFRYLFSSNVRAEPGGRARALPCRLGGFQHTEGGAIFVPVVNPQTRQDLASVINSDPQREQNILLLTVHRTLRLRLRLQEGKRWETLRNTSRQLVSDITVKIRKGSGN